MDPKHLHWAREEAATLVGYNDDGDHGNGDDEQKEDDEDDENIEDKHFPSSNWQTQTWMAVLTSKKYFLHFPNQQRNPFLLQMVAQSEAFLTSKLVSPQRSFHGEL